MNNKTLCFLAENRENIIGCFIVVGAISSILLGYPMLGINYGFHFCGIFIVVSGALHEAICAATDQREGLVTLFLLLAGFIIAVFPVLPFLEKFF